MKHKLEERPMHTEPEPFREAVRGVDLLLELKRLKWTQVSTVACRRFWEGI